MIWMEAKQRDAKGQDCRSETSDPTGSRGGARREGRIDLIRCDIDYVHNVFLRGFGTISPDDMVEVYACHFLKRENMGVITE